MKVIRGIIGGLFMAWFMPGPFAAYWFQEGIPEKGWGCFWTGVVLSCIIIPIGICIESSND